MIPEGGVITAQFYDIESGRMDLEIRGGGDAHEQFDIPIHRDGGIQDMLAEAQRPDRRFDYVICESIDRTARYTYYGTRIEHLLKQAGIPLLAADEPFQLTSPDGRKPKVATQLLTRRVKQSIAEFYVVDLLEKSWDGFAVHTEAGYNVGKACYGYRAKHVPHPVPAKRAKGEKKTLLEPDPAQKPAVQRIFQLRIEKRLGYEDIATRLNADLASYPPPVPVDPTRAVGCWTYSNVRDVLTNPKYTGHMVWNRRARKTGRNRLNPIQEWVWSAQPVHEPLVSLEDWIAAQNVSGHRFGSRSGNNTNINHPDTKRSYLLRTYLFCDLCGRRMNGKTRRALAYYVCAPKKAYIPEGHPTGGSFFVREDALIDKLNEFLSHHVFGHYRRALLADRMRDLDEEARHEREQRITALKREIDDIEQRRKRAIHHLELFDEPDAELIRDINERRAQLRHRQVQLKEQLAEAEEAIAQTPNPDLIDLLPVGQVDVAQLPEDTARNLFEALRLKMHYNKTANTVRCEIDLTAHSITTAQDASNAAILPFPRTSPETEAGTPNEDPSPESAPVPILVVPPAGLEPAT
ncbi:recombinase family protein [Haloechinothrix salitolerans]|uniref:Recombinase family protein n=1 Tax=Haloechinothrix salitolerans TaxID=926830 RepID=A0ABW2C602_9PSEU